MPAVLLLVLPLGLLALLPVLWGWRFALFCRADAREAAPPLECWPRVAVILPLRGADPALDRCLRGALNQDYARYAVYIVIDSKDDPARAVVEAVAARGCPAHVCVNVSVLRDPGERCSLKVSAQLQALAALPDDVEVVVLLDGDVEPRTDWLQCLVRPLADPDVAAVSGIRWFVPPDRRWGSWIRYLFNAGAFAQMYCFNIPWGGSLALRRSTMIEAGLPQLWRHCFGEDTSAYGPLRMLNKELRFSGLAMSANAETIGAAGAYRFVLRQLLSVRLQHPSWPVIALGHIGSVMAFLVCCALMFTTAWPAAAGVVFLYFAGQFASLFAIEQSSVARRWARRPSMPHVMHLAAGPVALVFATTAMLAAMVLTKIEWRGATYRIEPRKRIRLLQYVPFRHTSQANNDSIL